VWSDGGLLPSTIPKMKQRIVEALYAAIDDLNRTRTSETPLKKSTETALYGSASALDSLGLVNFLVAAEQEVEKEFGHAIVLADDRALSQDPSPFRSVGALADYIEVLLRELD
jgi:acyl carrier protein